MIETVKYVRITNLFENKPLMYKFLELTKLTCGDANLTLISKDRILGELDHMYFETLNDKVESLIETIESLPKDVYVDLEN